MTARFRTGSGSNGPLKAGARPQSGRLPGLDKAYMPEPVTGGAAPEDAESARIAAPGRMQSLARLVSPADIEAEAQAIAGVLKASAAWDISTGHRVWPSPSSHCRAVLPMPRRSPTRCGRLIRHAGARAPLRVVPGKRLQLRVAATAGYDASYLEQDVRSGIVEALGAASADGGESPTGLFSWQQRRFGESAHGSQIVAAIQNVPGVLWVELASASVRRFGRLRLTRPHIAGSLSAEWRAITCPPDTMLALDAADLALGLSAQLSEA